jgi:hypothetical protein
MANGRNTDKNADLEFYTCMVAAAEKEEEEEDTAENENARNVSAERVHI